MGDYIAASKRNNTAVVQTSTQNIVKTKLNPIGSQLSVYPINFFFSYSFIFFQSIKPFRRNPLSELLLIQY